MDIEVKEEVFDVHEDDSELFFDCDIVKEEATIQEVNVPVQRREKEETATNEELINFEITDINSKVKPKKKHKCKVCRKIFPNVISLDTHMPVHSKNKKFKCKICLKTFKYKVTLKTHEKSHTEAPVPCGICKKIMKNSASLRVHMMRKHGPPKKAKEQKTKIYYECEKCGKVLSNKNNLNRHIQRMHESGSNAVEGKLLTCPFCDMTFKSSFNHKQHVTFHSQHPEINFPCKICKKRFMLKEILLRHRETHSTPDNDAIFQCMYCTKSFKMPTSCQSHMKIYHRGLPKIEGATPACTICRKVFKNIEDLKKHVDESHFFECAICGAETRNKSSIQKHIMRVHLKSPHIRDRRDASCPICSKTMAKRHLKGHMNTHSKERPFACNTCDKAYKTKSQLKIHSFSHVA